MSRMALIQEENPETVQLKRFSLVRKICYNLCKQYANSHGKYKLLFFKEDCLNLKEVELNKMNKIV